MNDLKHKVEALLFSSGRKMSVEEIAKICRTRELDLVRKVLGELKDEYSRKSEALMVFDEGDEWKLTVAEKHLPVVRRVVTQTELSKTIIETLAVIAYKAPVLQSDVIKIRTNKAYEHIAELVESGYITATKHGRSKMIRLSQKFFEYFDIPPEKLKEKFSKFGKVEEDIARVEEEKKKVLKAPKQAGMAAVSDEPSDTPDPEAPIQPEEPPGPEDPAEQDESKM